MSEYIRELTDGESAANNPLVVLGWRQKISHYRIVNKPHEFLPMKLGFSSD